MVVEDPKVPAPGPAPLNHTRGAAAAMPGAAAAPGGYKLGGGGAAAMPAAAAAPG